MKPPLISPAATRMRAGRGPAGFAFGSSTVLYAFFSKVRGCDSVAVGTAVSGSAASGLLIYSRFASPSEARVLSPALPPPPLPPPRDTPKPCPVPEP